jgi:site-specific recombinase XerC
LKGNGVEAYFSTVVAAKKVDLKTLEAYKSDLLTITEEDRELGYKHVFQTRPTKTTTGERIRSPMGMFSRAQTFMDNDCQLLLDHLHEFYEG